MKVSPAVWSVLAVAATFATLWHGAYLVREQFAMPYVRMAFALCGFFAVLCWQRETILRRPRHIDGRAFAIGFARCCAGAFGLALIAALVLPLVAKPRRGYHSPSPQSNLKQLALAYGQYVQDYDNRLPPPGTVTKTRAALSPYINSEQRWLWFERNGVSGVFVPNLTVLGHAVSDFPVDSHGRSRAVLAYADRVVCRGGTGVRLTAFMDGKVEYIGENRFRRLLRETATQAATTRGAGGKSSNVTASRP